MWLTVHENGERDIVCQHSATRAKGANGFTSRSALANKQTELAPFPSPVPNALPHTPVIVACEVGGCVPEQGAREGPATLAAVDQQLKGDLHGGGVVKAVSLCLSRRVHGKCNLQHTTLHTAVVDP